MSSRIRRKPALSVERLERRDLLSASSQLTNDLDATSFETGFAVVRDTTHEIVEYRLHDGTYHSSLEPIDRYVPRSIEFARRAEHWVLEDQRYVVTQEGMVQHSLWKTDGTEKGTTRLLTVRGREDIRDLVSFHNRIYFSTGDELWVTGGEVADTAQVMSVGQGKELRNLTAVDNKLFFSAGRDELWVSDGSKAGSARLFTASEIRDLTVVNDKLYFEAEDQLWMSDGTELGTQLLEGNFGKFRILVATKDQLFLSAEDRTLWRTDGTDQGTYQLSGADNVQLATVVGDRIFYLAGGRPSMSPRGKLWVSDGTVEGTHQLTDFDIQPSGNRHGCGRVEWLAAGDSLYFLARDEERNDALWMSDGTKDGTVRLKDGWLNPIVATDNMVYLAGYDEATGTELWRTDGTPEGTVQVLDLNPGTESSLDMRSVRSVVSEGMLFFTADDGSHRSDLWYLPLGVSEQDFSFSSRAGDANGDGRFDQHDVVALLQAGKFNTSKAATFAEGDFNGDGVFNQLDIVAALQTANYLPGSFRPTS